MALNLNLSLRQHEPWTIRKTLEASDCGFQLLLPKHAMLDYIIPEMHPITAVHIVNQTVFVDLVDVATDVVYTMRLTQTGVVGAPGSFYFRNSWGQLVRAKGLKPGDEIGICYSGGKFLFHVLNVA